MNPHRIVEKRAIGKGKMGREESISLFPHAVRPVQVSSPDAQSVIPVLKDLEILRISEYTREKGCLWREPEGELRSRGKNFQLIKIKPKSALSIYFANSTSLAGTAPK